MSQTTLQLPTTGTVSGLSYTTQLNAHLAALASNNSGATEPTVTFAFMKWWDTSADPALEKVRNVANSAWITVGSLSSAGVYTPLIGAGAITQTMIADGSISTGKIADVAVTSGKLGSGSVVEAKIGSGAVTEGKIGAGAVTTDKLGANAVTSAKMSNTGASAGAYTNANVTIDAAGRVIAIASGTPGGANLVKLGTLTLTSGSSLALTSISASKALVIVLNGARASNNLNHLELALSSNNGSSYGSSFRITNSGSAGTPAYGGLITIFNTGVTATNKTIVPQIWDSQSDGGYWGTVAVDSGITGIVNALRISASSGNLGTGTAEIYGLQ
jgi:hypothetical protein